MITSQQTIDVQFGNFTIGLFYSDGRLTMTGLAKPATNKDCVERSSVDVSQPAICLHFPTAESVLPLLKQFQEVHDHLKKNELVTYMREELNREIELASQEDQDLVDDIADHEGCDCGHHDVRFPDADKDDEII